MITCLRRCSLKFSESETKAGCLTIASLCVSLIISQYINDITVWLKFYCNELEVKWSESRSVVSDSLRPHVLYSPWNSPGQNSGVGSLSLPRGSSQPRGSNPAHLHFRQILYQLSHKGSPRILEWVAYPFTRGSSQPRNHNRVSCIAGRFFTNWAIWEARNKPMPF